MSSLTPIFDSVVQVRSKKNPSNQLCSLTAHRISFDENEEDAQSSLITSLGCLQVVVKNQTAEVVVEDTLDIETPLWEMVQEYITDATADTTVAFNDTTETSLSGLLPPNLSTAEDDTLFRKGGTRSVVLQIPGKSASRAITVQFPTSHDAWSFCLTLTAGAVNASVLRGGPPCMWIPLPFTPNVTAHDDTKEDAVDDTTRGSRESVPPPPSTIEEVSSVTLRLQRMYNYCADSLVMQQAIDYTGRIQDAPHSTATLSLPLMREEVTPTGKKVSSVLAGMLGAYLAQPTSNSKPAVVVALSPSRTSESYIISELSKQFGIGPDEEGSVQRTLSGAASASPHHRQQGEDITTSFANTSFARNVFTDVAGSRSSVRMEPVNMVYMLVVTLVGVSSEEEERKARVLNKLRARNTSFVGMGGFKLPAQRSTSPAVRTPATSPPEETAAPVISPTRPKLRQEIRPTKPSEPAPQQVNCDDKETTLDNASIALANNNSLGAPPNGGTQAYFRSDVLETNMNPQQRPTTAGESEVTRVSLPHQGEGDVSAAPTTVEDATSSQREKVDIYIPEEGAVEENAEEEVEYTYEALTRLANKLERRKKRLVQKEEDLGTMEGEILRRADLMTQEQSELADERQRLQLLIQQQQEAARGASLLAPPTSAVRGRAGAQSTSSNGSLDADAVSREEPSSTTSRRPLSFQAVNNSPHSVFQPPRSPREFYDKRVLPGRLCDAFPLFTAYTRSVAFHPVPVVIAVIILLCAACLSIAAPILAMLLPDVTFVGLPTASPTTLINGTTLSPSPSTSPSSLTAMERSIGELCLIYFGFQSLIIAILVVRQFAFQEDDTYNLLHLVDHSLRYHAGTADGSPIPYIAESGNSPSDNNNRGVVEEGSPQAHQSFRFLFVVFWAPLVLLGVVVIPLLAFVTYNNSAHTTTDFCEDPNAIPFYFTPMTLLTFFLLAVGNIIGLQMILVPMGLVAHVLFHRIATCVPQQHGSVFSSVHIRSAMARYHYVRVRLGTRATQLYGATAGTLLTACVLSGILFGLVVTLWEPFVVGSIDETTGLYERTHPGVVLMGVVAAVYSIFTLVLIWGGIVGGFRQATQVSISSLALQCERWTRGDFVAETDMPFLPAIQKRQAATEGQLSPCVVTNTASGMCLFSQAITMFTSYCDSSLFAGMGVQLLPRCLQRLCCCCGIQNVVEPYSITFDNECETTAGGGANFTSVPDDSKAAAQIRKQRLRDIKKKRQSVRIEEDSEDNNTSDNTHRSAATAKSKNKGSKDHSKYDEGSASAGRPEDDDEDSYSADETTGLVSARPKGSKIAVVEKKPKHSASKRVSAHINGGNDSFNNGSGSAKMGVFAVRDTIGDDEIEFQDASIRASTIQLPPLCNIWWIMLVLVTLGGIAVGALYPTFQNFRQWKVLSENPTTCQGSSSVWLWAGEIW